MATDRRDKFLPKLKNLVDNIRAVHQCALDSGSDRYVRLVRRSGNLRWELEISSEFKFPEQRRIPFEEEDFNPRPVARSMLDEADFKIKSTEDSMKAQ